MVVMMIVVMVVIMIVVVVMIVGRALRLGLGNALGFLAAAGRLVQRLGVRLQAFHRKRHFLELGVRKDQIDGLALDDLVPQSCPSGSRFSIWARTRRTLSPLCSAIRRISSS